MSDLLQQPAACQAESWLLARVALEEYQLSTMTHVASFFEGEWLLGHANENKLFFPTVHSKNQCGW